MLQAIQGRVVRLAHDNVNTDVMTPCEYTWAVSDDDEGLTALRPHALGAIRPGLDAHVKPGDVFVVGKNFGCGSHRETAVQIFKVWGVQAVVTESAARTWFRNAISSGLPVFELKDATKIFEEGDKIDIDLKNWCIKNATKNNEAHRISQFPETVMRMLEVGGIMALVKQRLALSN